MTIIAKYPGRCRKCGRPISVGDKIDWESGKGAAHVECPEAEHAAPTLSRGSGFGGQPYTEGETFFDKQLGAITITKAWRRYFAEDGMSFGVGDESGYIYYAEYRAATAEDTAKLEADKAAKEAAEMAPYDVESHDDVEIAVIYRDGEYTSGYTLYDDDKIELLRSIGAAYHVSGWGNRVETKLVDALGERFSFGQARQHMRIRRLTKMR